MYRIFKFRTYNLTFLKRNHKIDELELDINFEWLDDFDKDWYRWKNYYSLIDDDESVEDVFK